MLPVNFQSALQVSDIQKYNGKNVEINAIADLLFDSSKVVLVFRTVPISTSVEVKLRALLRKNLIIMKRIKRKTPNIILKLSKSLFLNNSESSEQYLLNYLKIFDGSYVLVILEDFSHFLYFEKFFLLKLSKVNFSMFSFKMSNQYFLTDSSYFKSLKSNLVRADHNFLCINSFFFFQVSVVRNFLFFFIFFKYKSELYKQL
jgi:hypothetical protein